MQKRGYMAWMRPLFLLMTFVFMLTAVKALSAPAREERKERLVRAPIFKSNLENTTRHLAGGSLPYLEESWIDNVETSSTPARAKEPKAPAFYRRPDFAWGLGTALILSLIGIMLYRRSRLDY